MRPLCPPFDVPVLLRRCNGKSSLALTILEKFEKQVAVTVSDLQRLLDSSQAEPLARASHALKGTAGVLAAEPLRQAAGALEELARAGASADASVCLDRLKEEVDRCLAYVATARQQLSAAPVQPGGGAPCVS
jgi:HPt (histidine-containing phosphotransfer) domain-containing protein